MWDNVVGTVNILEFARKFQPDLDRFVYFSTDEVFGPAPRGDQEDDSVDDDDDDDNDNDNDDDDMAGVSYAEYDRYNSGNPYSAGKAGGEEFAVAYQNTYKVESVLKYRLSTTKLRRHLY